MSAIPDELLPVIFMGLMGVAMLLYAILDGYDLGTGILILGRKEADRDLMIASIGPFWDANETWLVLGVGVLLVAFPTAHGVILTTLYIPVALMLIALILRGVSFDFRAKAHARQKRLWDGAFFAGSLLATLSQGYMLGSYISGFSTSIGAIGFSLLSALCVTGAYLLIGACWLVLKTTGDLRVYAAKSGKRALLFTAVGLLSVSITNPLVSDYVLAKWLGFPQSLLLAPLPILTTALLFSVYRKLDQISKGVTSFNDVVPFVLTALIFILAFAGLAYSFYPMIVPGQLTVWDASSSPEALRIILWGVVFVLPIILAYTALSYYIFRGKSTLLSYS